jgi:transcriptional regulator GlxA family with amidase domain
MRAAVADRSFLERIASAGSVARLVTSVCTGAAALAAAGLLEGHRATTNKAAFAWASGFGQDVEWVPQARWVHDRTRLTSSGVAAGMDMTAALVADTFGTDAAEDAARLAELEVHTDVSWDPLARLYGPA